MTKLWDCLRTLFVSHYLRQFHLLQWKTPNNKKQLQKQWFTNLKSYTLYTTACTDYLTNHPHTALYARIQIIQSGSNICYQEWPYPKPMPMLTPKDKLFYVQK
jgi:hypothetical protein